jgi:hypothetical protein
VRGLDEATAALSSVLLAIEREELNASETERLTLERALVVLEGLAFRSNRF